MRGDSACYSCSPVYALCVMQTYSNAMPAHVLLYTHLACRAASSARMRPRMSHSYPMRLRSLSGVLGDLFFKCAYVATSRWQSCDMHVVNISQHTRKISQARWISMYACCVVSLIPTVDARLLCVCAEPFIRAKWVHKLIRVQANGLRLHSNSYAII